MLEERKCQTCGEVYLPPAERCLKDNQPLVTTNTLIGKVLDRRYRIEKVLGVGGMGAVYRSTHLGFGKEFAVKVLHPEMMEREDMFGRFRNEAKAMGRIEHEQAVKVTDFGVTEERLAYLVMEIVDGALLRALIDRKGMDYRRVAEILCQVCEAVQAAHQKNIIHRDLKPDNIIVQNFDGKERVKVLDFGIAKLREAEQEGEQQTPQTKVGMLVGTPQYMSPEQCKGMRGEELKATSDVYSLGVIAYEMLSGRLPFIASNTLGYINKHSNEPAPALRMYAQQVPPSVERVVMRALEKDPAQRQQIALEFARQLRTAVCEAEELEADTTKKLRKTVVADQAVAQQSIPNTVVRGAETTLLDEPLQTTLGGKVLLRWAWAALAVALIALLGYGGYQAFFNRKQPPAPRETQPLPSQQQKITDEHGVMVLIPAGTFEMGRDDGEDDEAPKHPVEIKAFYLDQYEVTNEQYGKFVAKTQHRAPSHWKGGSFPSEEALFPVTHVTWTDADAYAKWAGKRLPTEAEWEYAARGGARGYLYPWGNEWQAGYANANGIAANPAAVRGFEDDRGVFGVYGMAGNVSEWVASNLAPYPGRRAKVCAECKVIRGGNFNSTSKESIATVRLSEYPDISAANRKSYENYTFPLVGFRCAK